MKLTGLYRRWRHARAARAILPLLSALVIGVYPAFYYYTNNAALVRFSRRRVPASNSPESAV